MNALIKWPVNLFLAVNFFGAAAHAGEFQAKLSTGGFMGERALGIAYELPQRWRFLLGYGNSPALGTQIHQFNTTAEYAWFKPVRINPSLRWVPFTTGMGGVYTTNKEFFIESPEEYPERNYYEQTAFHALLVFGSQLRARFQKVRVYAEYFVSITDTYLTAQFNNPDWNSRYCCSTGFSVTVPF